MSFPYPENPGDWQKAYTGDNAYADSSRNSSRYMLPLILCFLIILAGALFFLHNTLFTTVFPLFDRFTPTQKVAFAFLGATMFFLVVMVAVLTPATRFAVGFFAEFYRPPENIEPATIINYRIIGKSKLPPPLDLFSQFEYIIVQDGKIVKDDGWPAWSARNLGGPLLMVVFDGCALYLERGNRFSRVVGPGYPHLEWYETIKYVVDLRPKMRDGSFKVWTKDGINITLTVHLECRIGDPSKNDPESSLVYPFDPVAVKKAIERYAVRWPKRLEGEPEEFTWMDAAWGQVAGIVPSYIGSRMLDDLFVADRENGQILSHEALKELVGKLNSAASGFGVFVTDFQIRKVEFPKEVYQHQKEHWKAERQSLATVLDGEAKADNIRVREKVRADALRNLILTIAGGLDKNKDDQFIEPLLLSLSGLLDESLGDPMSRAELAREKLEILEDLDRILDQQLTRSGPQKSVNHDSPAQVTNEGRKTRKPPSVYYVGGDNGTR